MDLERKRRAASLHQRRDGQLDAFKRRMYCHADDYTLGDVIGGSAQLFIDKPLESDNSLCTCASHKHRSKQMSP